LANVALRNVSKVYPGGVEALTAVDLEIQDGEFFVAVGPSGSGKSTLLRLIAGLEFPTAGEVWIGEERVDALAPRDRDVAMVFQTPALYPHLNVYGNLAFGLRARSVRRKAVRATVTSVAERLGITEVLRRMPRTLSGGQRQRVALGRAIARHPRVFLLDEPFSSLDAPLRASMCSELADLHQRLGITTILVTHDQAEAMRLGDRIAVVDHGRIVQVGAPLEVYDHPVNRFVATFIGQPPMNLLRCQVERTDKDWKIRPVGIPLVSCWAVPLGFCPMPPLEPGETYVFDLGLRAESLAIAGSDEDPQSLPRTLPATVEIRRLDLLGAETLGTVAMGPHILNLRFSSRGLFGIGDIVPIRLDFQRAVWFDVESGMAPRNRNP